MASWPHMVFVTGLLDFWPLIVLIAGLCLLPAWWKTDLMSCRPAQGICFECIRVPMTILYLIPFAIFVDFFILLQYLFDSCRVICFHHDIFPGESVNG